MVLLLRWRFLVLAAVAATVALGQLAAVRGAEIITLDVCFPTPGNPRHDHQLIFPLADDRLLLVWSEYYTSESAATKTPQRQFDHMPCRISAKISTDRGRNWGDSYVLLANTGKFNVKHPNLLRLPSGEVLFFYTEWNSLTQRVVLLRRSSDDCRTWSEPQLVSDPAGITNINNDHVLRLRTGRIVLPAFHSPVSGQGDHYQAFCHFSDDDGRTWQRSEPAIDLPLRGAEEPSMAELTDGGLLAMLRTSLGSVYQARSANGGRSWSEPISARLAAPAAPPLVKRIPATGDLLLIWNHHYEAGHHHQGERTPLSVALSRDEGQTWKNIRDIESVPGGAAAYPAVTFLGDEALVTYYYQPQGFGGSSGIRLKIIPLAWFSEPGHRP